MDPFPVGSTLKRVPTAQVPSNSTSKHINASRMLFDEFFHDSSRLTLEAKWIRVTASLQRPYHNLRTRSDACATKNLASRPSTVLQVKTKIVWGGNAVASSFDRNCNCAAGDILSASSTNTRWNPDETGTYQHRRIISSTLATTHCCDGMRCISARSVSAKARASVVFPVPGGPTKSHAD
jgi:hypothetical protein